jgi:hypothetical protein
MIKPAIESNYRPIYPIVRCDGHLSEKINVHCGHLSDNINGHFSDTFSVDPKQYVDNWATKSGAWTQYFHNPGTKRIKINSCMIWFKSILVVKFLPVLLGLNTKQELWAYHLIYMYIFALNF